MQKKRNEEPEITYTDSLIFCITAINKITGSTLHFKTDIRVV